MLSTLVDWVGFNSSMERHGLAYDDTVTGGMCKISKLSKMRAAIASCHILSAGPRRRELQNRYVTLGLMGLV